MARPVAAASSSSIPHRPRLAHLAPVAPAILVVDDDAAKRLGLRAMLAPLGHTIVEAESGRAALRAVLGRSFALIVMDVQMPTMDGFETARLIREQPRTRFTPIVFATGFGRDEVESETAYDSGAVDFIFMPIRPEVLRAKVSVFVDLYMQAQALESSLTSITALNGALRHSEERVQAVLDGVGHGIFILDRNGTIDEVNRATGQLFGFEAHELIGRPFSTVISADHRAEFARTELAHRGVSTTPGVLDPPTETVGRHRDGSRFPIEVERAVVEHGERGFTLAIVGDISERQRVRAELEHQALHDGLTGLPNRNLLANRLSHALTNAQRNGEQRAVLIVDLDGFKEVNDLLGHEAGDELLCEVSRRISGLLRDGDTVARLGGDEFAVLPAGATDLTAAAEIATKIRDGCAPAFRAGSQILRITASVGIALFPDHGTTAADLLRRADMAMYDAKRAGSGHAVFHTEHETQLTDRLGLLADLRRCVAEDQLVLHYQPQIDLATGRTTGVEALLRWQHPERGLLAPFAFMPELERIELMTTVTEWVLDEALHQQRMWRDAGLDLSVAVNVSARSLDPDSTLAQTVADLTALWGTGPGRLTLELTESALIEPSAPAVLGRLRELGQKIAIDDFGSGYSSLAYLKHLPLDELKIDRSLITGLAAGTKDEVIVRSTIDLAHGLGLTVVAEGIEDGSVRELLRAGGCDSAQGYFFSRPVPPADLTTWLTQSRHGALK